MIRKLSEYLAFLCFQSLVLAETELLCLTSFRSSCQFLCLLFSILGARSVVTIYLLWLLGYQSFLKTQLASECYPLT